MPAEPAAKNLDKFTSGSMAAKQAWDLAVASINAGDFDAALTVLNDLRTHTDLTGEQIVALNDLILAIENHQKGKTEP